METTSTSRTSILEKPHELYKFKILSQDKVYYIVYNNTKDTFQSYSDESCIHIAGLWHWQEREVHQTILDYFKTNGGIA